jgi:hypothetical protein
MSAPAVCAREGCTNTVPERIGRGRPFLYCSPACRPSPAKAHREVLSVEIDHEPTPPDERPAGRVWSVRLRRGERHVVIVTELGRPSAENLAAEITGLLDPPPPKRGEHVD